MLVKCDFKYSSIFAGLRRGASGTIMLGIQTYLAATFNPQFYLTTQFQVGTIFLYNINASCNFYLFNLIINYNNSCECGMRFCVQLSKHRLSFISKCFQYKVIIYLKTA